MLLLDFFKRNQFVVFLLLTGLLLVGIGLLVPKFQNLGTASEPVESKGIIKVDISGAVLKPGIYEFEDEVRVADVISKSGGLTDTADQGWISQNLNLAAVAKDEMKIFIPAKGAETTPNSRLENPSSLVLGALKQVSINNATASELDKLPGVGEVTAQKIITNRPYQSLEDLQTKKVVSKATFEKIKGLVTLY